MAGNYWHICWGCGFPKGRPLYILRWHSLVVSVLKDRAWGREREAWSLSCGATKHFTKNRCLILFTGAHRKKKRPSVLQIAVNHILKIYSYGIQNYSSFQAAVTELQLQTMQITCKVYTGTCRISMLENYNIYRWEYLECRNEIPHQYGPKIIQWHKLALTFARARSNRFSTSIRIWMETYMHMIINNRRCWHLRWRHRNWCRPWSEARMR